MTAATRVETEIARESHEAQPAEKGGRDVQRKSPEGRAPINNAAGSVAKLCKELVSGQLNRSTSQQFNSSTAHVDADLLRREQQGRRVCCEEVKCKQMLNVAAKTFDVVLINYCANGGRRYELGQHFCSYSGVPELSVQRTKIKTTPIEPETSNVYNFTIEHPNHKISIGLEP